MNDIRDLGPKGKAVYDTATKLQGAHLITDAQFKELTNTKVGPQDVAIANQALDKIKADTPDAMNLMMSIPKLNNNIISLQKADLGEHTQQLHDAVKKNAGPAANDWVTQILRAITQ